MKRRLREGQLGTKETIDINHLIQKWEQRFLSTLSTSCQKTRSSFFSLIVVMATTIAFLHLRQIKLLSFLLIREIGTVIELSVLVHRYSFQLCTVHVRNLNSKHWKLYQSIRNNIRTISVVLACCLAKQGKHTKYYFRRYETTSFLLKTSKIQFFVTLSLLQPT